MQVGGTRDIETTGKELCQMHAVGLLRMIVGAILGNVVIFMSGMQGK